MLPPMIVTSQSLSLVHTGANASELWLGDFCAARNFGVLRQRAIRSVLTAASLPEVTYPTELQISHKIIPAFDLPLFKMGSYFTEAFLFIREALIRGNLLVHCSSGNSRSAVFVLVYLMRGQGMTFQDGMQYLSSKRSSLKINLSFQQELRAEAPTTLLLPLFEITQRQINITNTQGQQQRPKRHLSKDKKCFSLGPVKSLSGKLLLSLERRRRGKSLRMAKPQSQGERRGLRYSGEMQDGRLPISKLSRQFLALRNDPVRRLIIQR